MVWKEIILSFLLLVPIALGLQVGVIGDEDYGLNLGGLEVDSTGACSCSVYTGDFDQVLNTTSNVTFWNVSVMNDLWVSPSTIHLGDAELTSSGGNIQVATGNITADYLKGSGAELTDINASNTNMTEVTIENSTLTNVTVEGYRTLINNSFEDINVSGTQTFHYGADTTIKGTIHKDAFGQFVIDNSGSVGIFPFVETRATPGLFDLVVRHTTGSPYLATNSYDVADDYVSFGVNAFPSSNSPLILTGNKVGFGVIPTTNSMETGGQMWFKVDGVGPKMGVDGDSRFYHLGTSSYWLCNAYTSSDNCYISLGGGLTYDLNSDKLNFLFNTPTTTDGNFYYDNTASAKCLGDGCFGVDQSFWVEKNLTVGDTLNVTGNIIQTDGNATINMVYGEMWNKTDGGFEIVDLVDPDVYVQSVMLECGDLNGFSCSGGNLTAQIGGLYRVNGRVSAEGISVAGQYGMKLFINDDGQNDCYSHVHLATNSYDMMISCLITLSVGDDVGIYFDDHANPVRDIELMSANVNLVRIGT